MPWTRKQVKLLLSKGSPLSAPQQGKVKAELHANPEMGHAKKGSDELKKPTAPVADVKKSGFTGDAHNYSHQRPARKVVSRYTR